MEAIRTELGVEKLTLYGISYGTELAIAYARAYPQHVERLILDSVVDADDTDPFLTATFRAMGPTLRSLCPAHCAGISADPGADLSTLVARLRAKPMVERRLRRLGALAQGHDHAAGAVRPDARRPTTSRRCARSSRPRSAPRSPATARCWPGSCATSRSLDVLGSPRDFSVARYSTVCETSPMPWDPGTPIDQRPAVTQQRLAALPANTFAPFDPPIVVEDEIDLCLRWPDVPRPPSTAAPLPYPTVPTLILQGGEDLRTPPEVSARIAARIPGSIRLVVPGIGHSTISDPRTCAADAILKFVRGAAPPTSLQANSHRHPGRRRRAGLVLGR